MTTKQSYDLKHSVPSYETVQKDSTFAFTFAPDDTFQHWKSPDRLLSFMKHMKTFFFQTLKGAYIKVLPEVSSLGRLHLHGYITIFNPMDFYLSTIHELVDHATIHIKPLSDLTIWETYCQKQHLDEEYTYVPPVYKPLKKLSKKPKKKELTDDELLTEGFLETL